MGNRAPEYVPTPPADLEKTILINSIQKLREVRAGTADQVEIAMPRGIQVANRKSANKIGRYLKKVWQEKYPEIFE